MADQVYRRKVEIRVEEDENSFVISREVETNWPDYELPDMAWLINNIARETTDKYRDLKGAEARRIVDEAMGEVNDG